MVINKIQFFIMLTVVKLALLLPLDDKFQQLFNRSDIQCPSHCSRYSDKMVAMIQCCVCYAEPKWNDVGNLKIEMTKNDTCNALFRNPLNLYTYSSSSSSSCVDPSATRRTTFASVLLICIN